MFVKKSVIAYRRGGMKKSVLTFGGASLTKGLISTPTRRGHPFVPTKGCKNGSGLRPENPVALLRWIRIYFQAAA